MMMLKKCNHVSNVQLAKGCEFVHHLIYFVALQELHKLITIFIEQVIKQKCLTHNQCNCKGCYIRCVKHLHLNQRLDLFHNLFAFAICNGMVMHAKVNGHFWKGVQFVNDIIHPTFAILHTNEQLTTKIYNQLCKLEDLRHIFLQLEVELSYHSMWLQCEHQSNKLVTCVINWQWKWPNI